MHKYSFKYPCYFILLLFICTVTFSSCQQQKDKPVFYTWEGIGPDKWASAWLINRKIDPQAIIRFIPVNEDISEGTAFDIPKSQFVRTNETSAIAKMVSAYKVESPVITDLIQIIHDIEVDFWSGHVHRRSPVIELAFRDLQSTYGRENVASACYLAFFDNLHTLLSNKSSSTLTEDAYKIALMPSSQCKSDVVSFNEPNKKKLVEEISILNLLKRAEKGQKIIYVDAREPNEFEEFHIPGAVNLRLRDVNASVASQFKKADKIIAYCLKDFRGFELARALQQKAGLKNTAIMKPYGINGWKALGLPVAGSKAMKESDALSRLLECTKNPDECLLKI